MKTYKYKFRQTELSRTQVKNNILAVLKQSNEATFNAGKEWYNVAHSIGINLVDKGNNINLAQSVGVIAALSPLKSWNQNIQLAEKFILNGWRKGHTTLCVDKANKILSLTNPGVDEVVEILNGQKIVNFFLNIYYPNKDVAITIDRHAVGIALIGLNKIKITEEECRPTKKQFEFLVHCYKWAAEELELSAVQLQAITWEHFRKVKVKRIKK